MKNLLDSLVASFESQENFVFETCIYCAVFSKRNVQNAISFSLRTTVLVEFIQIYLTPNTYFFLQLTTNTRFHLTVNFESQYYQTKNLYYIVQMYLHKLDLLRHHVFWTIPEDRHGILVGVILMCHRISSPQTVHSLRHTVLTVEDTCRPILGPFLCRYQHETFKRWTPQCN